MSTRRKEKAAVAAEPRPHPTKIVLEGFGEIYSDHLLDGPSCINWITIRRVRITREIIDEPVDVLADRLRTLWEGYTGHHLSGQFEAKAKELGVTLNPHCHDSETEQRRQAEPRSMGK